METVVALAVWTALFPIQALILLGILAQRKQLKRDKVTFAASRRVALGSRRHPWQN